MVAEVAGSTIIMVSAAAAAVIASAAMIQAAGTYDANAVANLAIHVWDRFGDSDMVWVETTLTYRGGHLEIAGDIPLCFEPPEGHAVCPLSGRPPLTRCAATSLNTIHGCWHTVRAGSALQVRYEGVAHTGFNVVRGEPLGYVVSGPHHTSSGVVGVR